MRLKTLSGRRRVRNESGVSARGKVGGSEAKRRGQGIFRGVVPNPCEPFSVRVEAAAELLLSDQCSRVVEGTVGGDVEDQRSRVELRSLRTVLEGVAVRQIALASDVRGLLASFPDFVVNTDVPKTTGQPPPFRQLPTRTGCLTIVVHGEARFYQRRHVVGTIRSFAAAVETGSHAHTPFERCIDA